MELIAHTNPVFGNVVLELVFHDGKCVRFVIRSEVSYKV
jgi:hypothetical protein